jgi:EmrB/QacA subfamily drug resistance transporter
MAEPGTTRGLVAACLAASLMPLNSTMIAVAVPDIAADVHHDPGTVTQALVATYLVAAIALQSPGGKLGDRIGQWRAFAAGQILLAAGALVGFVAPTLELLTFSRVVIAAGGAVVVPATIALLRSELPEEKRGRAFGVFGSVMSLAAGIGPLVGGELVRQFGWPSIFLANLPVLALSAVLAVSAHHVPTERREARFDWLGSVLLASLLACLVAGTEVRGNLAIALVVIGAVLVLPFVVVERRASDPVLGFRLFGNVRFTAGTLVVALLNLVMYALLFEIPLVLEALFKLDAGETGRVIVFMMLAMVVTSSIAGRLTDRLGPRPLGLAGTLVCLVGVVALWAVPMSASGDVRLPLALLGVGIGLANPAAQTASMAGIARSDSGMAAGISSTMRYLGGIVGIAILGRGLEVSGSRADMLGQHHLLLVIFAGVLVLTLVCAALLGPRARPVDSVLT